MNRAFYLSLTPWLVFAMADRTAGAGPVYGAFIAGAAGLLIVIVDLRRGVRHLLPPFAVGYFGAYLLVAALTGNPRWESPLSRASSVAALAVVLALSLLRRPATMAYGVADVAPSRAASTSFRHRHRCLTCGWALAAAAASASMCCGLLVRTPVGLTIFDWLLPAAVVAAAAWWSSAGDSWAEGAREEAAPLADLLRGIEAPGQAEGTLGGLRLVRSHPGSCDA